MVNGIAFAIHHVVNSNDFLTVAFIFGERASRMVNAPFPGPLAFFVWRSRVNFALKHVALKHMRKGWGKTMPVQRKRFRVENIHHGSPVIEEIEHNGEPMPHHSEIMSELRAIRAQMAGSHRPAPATGRDMAGSDGAGSDAAGGSMAAMSQEVSEMQATLETYRAQIEQCEKLKIELDLIHEAINRTKQEIAVLHGKSFNGAEMAKVTGELGAVVGGTEQATQQILEAAEAIDQAASALTKVQSADQQARLSEDILEKVVAIFEACNFQDLTGQRISKVMNTMKFIEHHINVMMDIWGGVDAIKAVSPGIVDDRVGDARLLNGPKLDGDQGHASQDDIDALFG